MFSNEILKETTKSRNFISNSMDDTYYYPDFNESLLMSMESEDVNKTNRKEISNFQLNELFEKSDSE